MPVGEEQALHLSGTDYYEIITDEEFLSTRSCWERSLISEDKEVYRSEYLAAELLAEAETGRGRGGLEELKQRALQSDLLTLIQDELGLRRGGLRPRRP